MSGKYLISTEAIARHLDAIGKIGNLGPTSDSGYFRAAYSDEETAAMRYVEGVAKQYQLATRWDVVGNLTIETRTDAAAYAETGSHLDTVPAGGNFDGVAGVIAGLEALSYLKGIAREQAFRLRVWRGEESPVFSSAYLGSLSAFGKLDPALLNVAFEGITLAAAMKKQGCDPEAVRCGTRTISQAEVDSTLGHIELHIEQGRVLETGGTDIGIVTSVRGPQRYRVTLRGEFNHSGTTPMGVEYRHDVNLAIGYVLVRLDQLALKYRSAGADLVQTVGIINSDASINDSVPELYLNALSKVSGYGYFCLDVRSANAELKAEYCQAAEDTIAATAKELGVSEEIQLLSKSAGVPELDPHLQEVIAQSANRLGFSAVRLASGAGHDAAIVAKQTQTSGRSVPAGMIFIPCRGGISHNPAEFTTPEAIAAGASVLARALAEISK